MCSVVCFGRTCCLHLQGDNEVCVDKMLCKMKRHYYTGKLPRLWPIRGMKREEGIDFLSVQYEIYLQI